MRTVSWFMHVALILAGLYFCIGYAVALDLVDGNGDVARARTALLWLGISIGATATGGAFLLARILCVFSSRPRSKHASD